MSTSCGIADDDLAHHLADAGDEVVVELTGHDRARRRRAVLPAVDQRSRDGTLDSGVQIGVVEHHEWRLAAQFELHAVALHRGGGHHLAADGGRPGERDKVDVRVPGQCGADIGTRPGHHVEHAVGQPGFAGQPGQRQRRQGCQLARLDHHGAAGGQRGQHFPHRHLQGVVPWRDGADHTDRLAPDARRVVAGVLRGGLALEVAGRACEEVDVVDAARHIEFGGQSHRFAGLTDLLGHQIVGVLAGQHSQLGQHRGAVGGRRRRPAGQRRIRGADGAVHIGGCRHRIVGGGLTGRGVDHLMQAATGHHRGTVDPAACHAGGNGRSHGPTLADGEQRGYAFPQREGL